MHPVPCVSLANLQELDAALAMLPWLPCPLVTTLQELEAAAAMLLTSSVSAMMTSLLQGHVDKLVNDLQAQLAPQIAASKIAIRAVMVSYIVLIVWRVGTWVRFLFLLLCTIHDEKQGFARPRPSRIG